MMKRFLASLLLVAALGGGFCPRAEAANSATDLPEMPYGGQRGGGIYPYIVAIDTVDTDLIVRTPATGNMVCVVGLNFLQGAATNVTWKSGSTTLLTWNLAANQGISHPISKPLLCTVASQALVVRASVVMPNMLLYVIETSTANFDGR